MRLLDVAGFLASTLVVAAFCMEDIISLRVVALMSNVGFLIYGVGLGLAPVWLLHAVLLPVNAWRLWQASRCRGAVRGCDARANRWRRRRALLALRRRLGARVPHGKGS
jgi:hypothetical protein